MAAFEWERAEFDVCCCFVACMNVLCAGSATTQQAVMLTRCTGSVLVKETPEERTELCDQVCKVLESVGEHFVLAVKCVHPLYCL